MDRRRAGSSPGVGTPHNRLTRRRVNAVTANLTEEQSMPTRRSFITTTLGAGVVLATQAAQKAAAQADRRMIVDAQVHLWKVESPDWKWVPGLPPQLPEPFTIER